MSRSILVLRHAKSSWATGEESDFDRPLNERGKQDAKQMGRWIRTEIAMPELILASPARRVKQTLKRVCKKARWSTDIIRWEKSLYLAGLKTLRDALDEAINDHQRVMLVGHNPGLEELVKSLCSGDLPYTVDNKLLTTGNLVEIEIPQTASVLADGSGRLLKFKRPVDLSEG